MSVKLLIKGLTVAASDPEGATKAFFVVLVVLFFPLLVITAPFVLFLSVPLAPPSVTEAYIQGTQLAIETTADGWDGPVSIDWRDVLVVDAVRKKQDFSRVQVRDVQETAANFVELVELRQVPQKTGYERVYDQQGRFVETRPVYILINVPVYRARSLDEVMSLLGFTPEERQWAATMLHSFR